MRRIGDDVFVFGLFVWVWIAVGPWYVGVALLSLGTALNFIAARMEEGANEREG